MAKTIQKKVKFSKGQVVPELAERVDLSILDESAQKMKNVISTVYGGVRTRGGSRYIDKITDLNEATPTSITSDIFANTSNFTDNTDKSVQQVGSNRLLALLDFGVNQDGAAKITLKNIAINPYTREWKSPVEANYQIPKGLYEVVVVGAGGGSGAGYADFSKWHGAYGTGGSGAAVVGNAWLNAGTYTIKVGAGTTGPNGSEVGVGGEGEQSFIGGVVVCNGGTGGAGDYYPEKFYAGKGGTYYLTSSVFEKITHAYNGNDGSYGEGTYLWGTWSGGAPVYSTYGGGATITSALGNRYSVPGGSGYVRCKMLNGSMDIVFSVSQDGNSWVEVSRQSISLSKRDIEFELNYRYRYVKAELSLDSSFNVCGVSFQYIREFISVSQGITSSRMIPFVYNNEDKYLLFFSDERIQIFKDDLLISVLNAPGLTKDLLRSFKATQKDDTIVLTHPDIPPKIIKRVGGSFSYSNLYIKNIPFAVFGTETETKKTSWIKPSGEEGAVKLKSVQDKDNTDKDGEDIFTADMVGQYIDGNGGRIQITEFVSTKEVGGNTVIPFYTADAFNSWTYISGYERVWSATRGYPRTCLFASQRLWFGGSKQKPNTIWGSRLGDYFNFKNSGNYDNDSIDVTLLTNEVIVNMMDNRGLHIFTSGEEITASESSLTPSGFSATINTKNGSLPDVLPTVLGDGTCLFVEKNGKSLLSYIYDYNQSSYTTGNLTMLSNLMNSPVSMSLQRNSNIDKGDFLFVVLEDGTMLVNCFVLKENINSLSLFETDGKIKDVCCVLDDVYLTVERNGFTCIEKLDEKMLADSVEIRYVDTDIIKDLYKQNNSYVFVWSDDVYYGRFYVNGNQIKLPTVPQRECYIGISYICELVSNNIAVNGKTTNVKKRITSAEVVCKPDKTKQLIFNGQKKNKKDGIYTFYSCTPYGKEVNFNIRTEFEPFEVYSITLNINYEG